MCVKLTISFFLLALAINTIITTGIKPYYSCKEYSYTNGELSNKSEVRKCKIISQDFIAKGNILTNVKIYFSKVNNQEFVINLKDNKGKILKRINIKSNECIDNEWNNIALDYNKLDIKKKYTLEITSNKYIDCVYVGESASKQPIFLDSKIDGKLYNGLIGMGMQFSYKYLTIASVVELILSWLVLITLTSVLVYSLYRIEKLYKRIKNKHVKTSICYALYFSLLYLLFVCCVFMLKYYVV